MGNDGKIGNLVSNLSKLTGRKRENISGTEEGYAAEEGFKHLLKRKIVDGSEEDGIQFSLHATKRLEDRNLEIDNDEFIKLRGAIKKIKDKGGQESLIITNKAAYIVDVNESRIVTAIDKDNMGENVFTKIDSTLIVN